MTSTSTHTPTDASTMNAAIFPDEFNSADLRLGSRRQFGRNPDDWSLDLYYNDLPLQVQTPWLRNVFGLSQYQQPNGRVAYSMSFDLGDDSQVAEFHRFLVEFEEWFKGQLREMGIDRPFYSSIRPAKNPKYHPTLRLKMKTRNDTYDCVYLEGRKPVGWQIGDEKVHHGDKARLVIQLMPIWSAGGRVGISWKVASCQKEAAMAFRPPMGPTVGRNRFQREPAMITDREPAVATLRQRHVVSEPPAQGAKAWVDLELDTDDPPPLLSEAPRKRSA